MTATLLSLPIPAQKKATSSQDHKHWGQLQGSSPALCIAQAQAQYNGPIVLITADTPSALKLEKNWPFLWPTIMSLLLCFQIGKPYLTTLSLPIKTLFLSA